MLKSTGTTQLTLLPQLDTRKAALRPKTQRAFAQRQQENALPPQQRHQQHQHDEQPQQQPREQQAEQAENGVQGLSIASPSPAAAKVDTDGLESSRNSENLENLENLENRESREAKEKLHDLPYSADNAHAPKTETEAGTGAERAEVERAKVERPRPAIVTAKQTDASKLKATRRGSLWYCLYLPHLAALPEQEQTHCLERLAQLSQAFSSAISLHPQALVFEIRSGLNYFGGAESLHNQYRQQVEKLLAELAQPRQLEPRETARENIDDTDASENRANKGSEDTTYEPPAFSYAACPTVEGSLLLARGGGNTLVYRKENLGSALGQLSLETLQLKPEAQRRLINMGVRRLADLWRLPPAGLRRRFGSDFLTLINKALGKAPEPIKNYLPPPAFVHSYELPYEVENLGLLRPVVDEMLAQLCDFLRHRELCASSVKLSLLHERREATLLDVGLRQASRSQQHLMMLVDTHFDNLQIPAAVTALRLEATQFDAFMSHSESLLIGSNEVKNTDSAATSLGQFMERLQARLGGDQVKALATIAEHGPEYASATQRPGKYASYPLVTESASAQPQATPTNPRPLWLLDEPVQLSLRRGSLFHKQAITLLSGPERIESRWWSGTEVCRDYYVARESGGSRLWIYREREGERHWYLHGYFA